MISFLLACFASLLSFLNFPSYAANIQNVYDSERSCNVNNVLDVDESSVLKKDVLHNEDGQYYIATSVDLQSTYFLWMTYYRLGGTLGTNEYMFDYSFNCYATDFNNFNLSSPFDSGHAKFISAISVTCLNFQHDEYGKRVSDYSVTLYYDNNGNLTTYLTFTYTFIYGVVSSLGIEGNEGTIFTEYEFTQRYFYWPDSSQYYRTTSYFYDIDSYSSAYNDGYSKGYGTGSNDGYQSGYNAALQDMSEYSSTAATIFEGIFDVGLLPVNVFLTIFNFNVFGINIAGIVSGLLTLSVVIIIVRMLVGGKDDK